MSKLPIIVVEYEVNMKILFTLSLIMFIQSCDNPTRTRFQTVGAPLSDGEGNSSSVIGDNETGSSGQPTPAPEENNTSASEPGYEDCQLNYNQFSNSIGYIAICQHDQDERQFKFKLSQSDYNQGTCFVPIHILSNGNSYKLGIAQCVNNQADKVYYMTLRKERAEPINGIMVIKAGSLNAYMQCMNAKADYIRQHPGCEYDRQCMYRADQYAYSVCSQFKNNHYQYYKQLNL